MATHCVTVAGAGAADGTDWDNAYAGLPATLTRGDQYLMAKGTYGDYTFNDATDGSNYIDITQALESNAGDIDGWDSGTHYGQVVFEGSGFETLLINTDRYRFTGEYTAWSSDPDDYGIRIQTTNTTTQHELVHIDTASAFLIIFTGVAFMHEGEDTGAVSQDCLYCIDSTVGYIIVTGCLFGPVNRTHVLWQNCPNSSITYCRFRKRNNTGAVHGEAINWEPQQADASGTIAYNVFEDNEGTAVIAIKDADQGGIDIYGNVFYSTAAAYSVTNGVIANTGAWETYDVKVHNNTFYNLYGAGEPCSFPGGSGAGVINEAYNNLIIDNNGTLNWSGTTHDYNHYDNSGGAISANDTDGALTYVDEASYDLRLAEATVAGTTLASPFDTDAYAGARGADGVWDRGAFEYNGRLKRRSRD